jgi:tetratricopeptide (TPR) repeat protein
MDRNDQWTVLTPTEMKSETGARLELQQDGSVFVHQVQPARNDTYSLVFQGESKGITGLRLEVLADSRLPQGGPGWGPNGNFVLHELTLDAAPAASPGHARSIALRNATADFSQAGDGFQVRGAVDGKDSTGWAIWPEVGKNHTAIFELTEEVSAGPAARLTVRLIHKHAAANRNVGRFRLSVTSEPTIAARKRRHRVAAMKLADPWARLAAAYHVMGDEPALASLLKDHPEAAAGLGDLFAADQDWERAITEYHKALTDPPNDGNALAKLAAAYQSAGRTREAVPHLAALSSANPNDTFLLQKVGALQAWFAQDQVFAVTRQRALATARGTKDAGVAGRMAMAVSILPPADKADVEAALALARSAVKVGGSGPHNLLALGMAEYRSGNDAASEKALVTAAKAGSPAWLAGTAAFYRAMSLFRQGKPDEARTLAAQTAARMKPFPHDEENPLAAAEPDVAGDSHADNLILWLACKEAKALIHFDAAPAAAAPRDAR